jgi:hypothetical protein
MSRRNRNPGAANAILAALLALAVAFVCVELVALSVGDSAPRIQEPCSVRTQLPGDGVDATVQRIVLVGLDGAACRLHTTREDLVLSLGSAARPRSWDRDTAEVAIRAGLEDAVDAADASGDIPGFLASVLRRLVQTAPIDKLVAGGIGLRDLIG